MTAWRNFSPGVWTDRVDVRDFLQKNVALSKTLEEKLRKLIFPDRDIPGSQPLGTVNNRVATDSAAAAALAAPPAEPPKAKSAKAVPVATAEEPSELF